MIFFSTGIIAVSCGEGLSFDDRVDHFSRILMTSSLVLIWSFSDPIHPLVCINYMYSKLNLNHSSSWLILVLLFSNIHLSSAFNKIQSYRLAALMQHLAIRECCARLSISWRTVIDRDNPTCMCLLGSVAARYL